MVPGKRTAENVEKVVQAFQQRTDDEALALLTSDEYRPYEGAIHQAYGEEVIPPPTGKPGRPAQPYLLPPKDLNYATVHKTRQQGRVVDIEFRTVFGTEESVQAALEASAVSAQVNTAFIERHHATDRHRNARKTRKSYCFSKTGTSMKPSPISPCIVTTSAGRYGPCGRKTPRGTAMIEPRRWPLD